MFVPHRQNSRGQQGDARLQEDDHPAEDEHVKLRGAMWQNTASKVRHGTGRHGTARHGKRESEARERHYPTVEVYASDAKTNMDILNV